MNVNVNINANININVNVNINVIVNININVHVNVNINVIVNININANVNVNININVHVNVNINVIVNININVNVNININVHVNVNININVHVNVNINASVNVNININPTLLFPVVQYTLCYNIYFINEQIYMDIVGSYVQVIQCLTYFLMFPCVKFSLNVHYWSFLFLSNASFVSSIGTLVASFRPQTACFDQRVWGLAADQVSLAWVYHQACRLPLYLIPLYERSIFIPVSPTLFNP